MVGYRLDEIINKHGQRISYFSKQSGKTDKEKCINFLKSSKEKFKVFQQSSNIGIIYIITENGAFQVFNALGEKINEHDFGESFKISRIENILEELDNLGYIII